MNSPIRWIGSKRKLLSKIQKHVPRSFDTYYELFAGSCALFFNLEPKKAIISDLNQDLMCFYEVLRDDVELLIQELKKIKTDEATYYEIRNWDRETTWPFSKTQRAVRFLYLNKMGFNGLWRLNSKGQLNVAYRKSEIIDYTEDLLTLCSFALKNTMLYTENFTFFLDKIKENDFVYLDPPYIVNSNSGESKYAKEGFAHSKQLKLIQFCKNLTKKNVKFVLSNSYSEETMRLYEDFNIEIIEVKRCVGALEKTRKFVKEILVSN